MGFQQRNLCHILVIWLNNTNYFYRLFGKNILKFSQMRMKEGLEMGYKKSVYKSFAMISQVGIAMLVPIFLCCML